MTQEINIDQEAVEIQSHEEWAREDTDRRRLAAYADTQTGSDRFFAEANRLQAQGKNDKAEAARASGCNRYEEIKTMYPWPGE